MTAFPVLETERLVLTPFTLGDVADCAALWGDPETMTFIGSGKPLTFEEVWSRVLRHIGHWHALGYGYWCVREKADGRFVGDVGFQTLRRAMEPALGDRPEVGWVLVRQAQGRGFAREAVAAALGWADSTLAAPETTCIIRPAHERSIRIAEAFGYRLVGPARYGAATIDVFVRPKGFRFETTVPMS